MRLVRYWPEFINLVNVSRLYRLLPELVGYLSGGTYSPVMENEVSEESEDARVGCFMAADGGGIGSIAVKFQLALPTSRWSKEFYGRPDK